VRTTTLTRDERRSGSRVGEWGVAAGAGASVGVGGEMDGAAPSTISLIDNGRFSSTMSGTGEGISLLAAEGTGVGAGAWFSGIRFRGSFGSIRHGKLNEVSTRFFDEWGGEAHPWSRLKYPSIMLSSISCSRARNSMFAPPRRDRDEQGRRPRGLRAKAQAISMESGRRRRDHGRRVKKITCVASPLRRKFFFVVPR